MDIINLLPEHISLEVLEFLDPNINLIHFKKKQTNYRYDTNYSDKYDIAYGHDNNIICKQINYYSDSALILGKKPNRYDTSYYMLSRIPKKSGANRYYITIEISTRTCQGCGSSSCSSMSCRGAFDYESEYSSKYVGKSLVSALIIFTKL